MIKGLAREVINASNSTSIGQNPLDIMTNLSTFFVEAIQFLRREKFDDSDEAQWATFNKHYQNKLLRMKERPERPNNVQVYLKEMSYLQELVEMPAATRHQTILLLPSKRNAQFFGRTEILRCISAHFSPDRTLSLKATSMALYGMGGVGKTSIALEYAYRSLENYDAIFWMLCGSQLIMDQSFTNIAVKLRLDGELEDPQDHATNRYLVQNWLQHTSKCDISTLTRPSDTKDLS